MADDALRGPELSSAVDEDYSALTREELIERLVQLRREVRSVPAAAPARAAARPAPGGGSAVKRKRDFDFSRYAERPIALKVAYDGRTYDGLARLDHTDNTVEGQLLIALEKTCLIRGRSECRFSKAGRTDKGVSSSGQVVALIVRSNMPLAGEAGGAAYEEIDYTTRLNQVLPHEIRVLAWAPVGERFDARFSARYRVYRYFFLQGSLDLELMRQAAQTFVGTHDFRNFCKADTQKVHSFERTLASFEVTTVSGPFASGAPEAGGAHRGMLQLCAFEIKGRAFLWHQVRCMVSVLFLVGQRLEPPDVVGRLLDVEREPCKPQYSMASELPLVLHEIGYDEKLEWHNAKPDHLAGAVLKSFCDASIHHAFVSTMLGCASGAAPPEQWWPTGGHLPGGGDKYSNSRLSKKGGVSKYVPLLSRWKNPPLTWPNDRTPAGEEAAGMDDE